jgi:UrcA family protein
MARRILPAAVAALLAAPAFAVAPENTATGSAEVTYRDVDLNSGASTEQVYFRITQAARTACGDDGDLVRDLWAKRDIERCENDAIANAVARIDDPGLTAIYDHSPRD